MKKSVILLLSAISNVYAQDQAAQTEAKNTISSKSPAGMSDADTTCYSSRYGDVSGDARKHFLEIGESSGRLPTCARNLTDYEAQTYLDRNPDLQHKFGRKGNYAKSMARDHYTDFGYNEKRDVDAYEWDTPWYCGDTDLHECDCTGGLLYRTYLNDPITGQRMDQFQRIRQFAFQTKKVDDFEDCTAAAFGGDTLGGARHQCWCEPQPINVPTVCAEEPGDECLCNGYVTFGQKWVGAHKHANWYEAINNYWTVNDWNNSKSNTCDKKNFEGVDPLPGEDKSCYCDEDRSQLSDGNIQAIKEYWRGIMAEKAAEEERARREAEEEAARKRAAEEEAKRKADEEKERKQKEAERKRREAAAAAEKKAMEEAEKKRQECEDKRKKEEDKRIAKEEAAYKKDQAESIKKEKEAEDAAHKAAQEKDAKKRQALMEEAEKKKNEAIAAKTKAGLDQAGAEHDKEMERLRAEQEADRRRHQKEAAEAKEAARKEAEQAEREQAQAKEEEERAREEATAREREAEAAANKEAADRALAEAQERIAKAIEEKERQEHEKQERERRRREDRENREAARKEAAHQRQMEAERRRHEEFERQKARQQEAERRLAEQKKNQHEDAKRLDEEQHRRALEQQEARQALLNAQRAEAMSQSQEDTRAAQEATRKAEEAFAQSQANKKAAEEHRKQLEEDLRKKDQENEMAKQALEKAQQEQREAEESAKRAHEEAEAAKKKSLADIARKEKEQRDHEERIRKEKEANIKKHEAAIKAQKEAFEKAKKAAHEAALAEEAERKKAEAQAIADHKAEMAERRAKFEAKFRNVWATGPTGVSRFQFTSDTKGAAEETVGVLLSKTMVADVEISKYFYSRTLSLGGNTNQRSDGVVRVTGVTSDDRVAEMIEEVAVNDPNKSKNPGFDLIIMPLSGGSTEYLAWVKQQTLKKDPSAAFFNEKPKEAMKALDNAISDMVVHGTHHFQG